jgi:hypothetical protein
MSHLRGMATLLGSLTGLFTSSSAALPDGGFDDQAAPMLAARALIAEDFGDEYADTTAPPWSSVTSESLAPAAMELAETLEVPAIRPASFRLPLPLQAYVAGGALALFAAWIGHHPPKATIDNARGEVVAMTEAERAAEAELTAAATQAPAEETVAPAPAAPEVATVSIDSLPTVAFGNLPVSAILTINIDELPNAPRLAVPHHVPVDAAKEARWLRPVASLSLLLLRLPVPFVN